VAEFVKGYEFVDGRPVLRPDYDYERISTLAGAEDEHGFRVVTIDVPKGETAWNPGSTKHLLHGPVKIRYELHRSGVRGTIL
jgi:hypothetical protein